MGTSTRSWDGAQQSRRRTRWTEEQAREALEELEASGESTATFARRKCVSGERLTYWRKRFAGTAKKTKFVAVTLPARADATATSPRWIEIVAGCVVVRIPEQLDVEHVARLVEAIGRRSGDRC